MEGEFQFVEEDDCTSIIYVPNLCVSDGDTDVHTVARVTRQMVLPTLIIIQRAGKISGVVQIKVSPFGRRRSLLLVREPFS